MIHTRDEILASAKAMFGESRLKEVLAVLDEYGIEKHEAEVNRVKLALIQLSKGRMETLQYYVKTAKMDYRDVLASQQLGPLSPEVAEKLQAMAQSMIRNLGKQ